MGTNTEKRWVVGSVGVGGGADYIRYKHSGIQNMGKGDLCKGVRFSWILQLKRDDRREKS